MKIEIGFLQNELSKISKSLIENADNDTFDLSDVAYAKGRLDGLIISLDNLQETNKEFNDSRDLNKKKKKVLQDKKDTMHDCMYIVRTLFNLLITDSSLENKNTFLAFKNEFDSEIDNLIKELLAAKSFVSEYEPKPTR